MTFGRRAHAPRTAARTAPTVPVLTVAERTAWTGEHALPASPPSLIVLPRTYGLVPAALAGAFTGAAFLLAFASACLAAEPTAALILETRGESYVLDYGLTPAECARAVSLGVSSYVLESGLRVPVLPSDVLFCETSR